MPSLKIIAKLRKQSIKEINPASKRPTTNLIAFFCSLNCQTNGTVISGEANTNTHNI